MKTQAFVLAAAVAALPPFCAAQTTDWIGGSGNWSDAPNWDNGVPAGGGVANFSNGDGVSRTVTYDAAVPLETLASVTVNLSGGTGGASNTLLIPGNQLTSNFEYVGDSGTGSNGVGAVNQTGGLNAVGTLSLGVNSTDNGTYTLSGTGAVSSGPETLGQNGNGMFIQTGGTNSIVGAPQTTQIDTVGAAGGTRGFDCLDLGAMVSGTGAYCLSGSGSLLASGGFEVVGELGVGTFSQTGGTNTLTNGSVLVVGYQGTGSYCLSGSGALVETAGDELVGDFGVGQFLQSGGTNSIYGTSELSERPLSSPGLLVGEFGSNCAYTLSGGVLNVDGQISIIDASNKFIQSGGINTTSSLSILDGGNYLLSGGTLTVTQSATIETPSSSPSTFTQTGGIASIAGNLSNNENGPAVYTLCGGTLSVGGQLSFLGPRFLLFSVTGGSATVGSLYTRGCTIALAQVNGLTVLGTSLMAPDYMGIQLNSPTDYGSMTCDGPITDLTGSLSLSVGPDYSPQIGDTFPIIVGESGEPVPGEFSEVYQPYALTGDHFAVEYDPPDNPYGVDVVYVPEPGSVGLAGLALFWSPLKRRRRRSTGEG